MKKKFYVTTPIYYPSGKLHLGHTYTSISGDVISRYKKQCGYDVLYLTGTDEHGQKIEEKAKEAKLSPQKYVDQMVDKIKPLWKNLDVEYDLFIRTTDEIHKKEVQNIFDILLKNGDIYLGQYEGLYCTSCESYYTINQLQSGKCPDCNGEVKKIKEESYFFKCSKYVDQLMKHFEENEDFILPISRKNEIIKNFIKPGLQDLAVSRTNFKWGIPVKGDEKHVIYVWIDALTNYINALQYPLDFEKKEEFWPADLHIMAKEITRFHVIYWPMILMALGKKLPKKIFAHGWILMGDEKMSKSKGNVIYPDFLIDRYGSDTIRYYLLREVPFGMDGRFTPKTFVNRINNDLANDLGNLVSRSVAMGEKYFNGEVREKNISFEENENLKFKINEKIVIYKKTIEELSFSKNLDIVWEIISLTNKFIDLTQPWVLAKEDCEKEKLEQVMFDLFNAIRIINALIYPYMPKTSKKIMNILGLKRIDGMDDLFQKYSVYKINIIEKTLFPRLDTENEIELIEKEMKKYVKNEEVKKNFEEFQDFKIVVGKIVSSDKVPETTNLLVNKIDIGNKIITVVSGIGKNHNPKDILSLKVQVLINLNPAIIRGVKSEGVILCTTDKNKNSSLIILDEKLEVGTVIK